MIKSKQKSLWRAMKEREIFHTESKDTVDKASRSSD